MWPKEIFFFKFKNKKIKEEVVEIQRGRSQITWGCRAGGWQSWESHGEVAAAVTGGCPWHNAGHALRSVSPNTPENPLEVIIITVVIVTPTVWMPSTSLGDIQGCAAGKQAQAVWLFSQSFNLMLCCPLCSLPAFQASNQCSSRLGRRDEPGPRMFHHFDDVA